MALTGVILRRENKSSLINNPPRIGEIVYALDTEEYGSLQNGDLLWKKFTDIITSVNNQTGNITIDKNSLGLSNVDNTSDIDKPVSGATQNLLNAHETAINPHDISKNTIGLSNVDNTSDIDKPVSTATQTAINDATAALDTIDDANKLGGIPANEYALIVDYFTKLETQDLLNNKADKSEIYTKTSLDSKLNLKADNNDLTILENTVSALSISDNKKAEISYVDSQDTILENKKADKSDVNSLSDTVNTNTTDIDTNKSNISTNTNDISVLQLQKANKTYVDSQDEAIQSQVTTNTNDINNLTAGGVTKSYVDTKNDNQDSVISDLDSSKADKTYVDSQDTTLQNNIDALNSSKADKSYVDAQDSNLGAQISSNSNDITDLNTLVSTKADKTYVDSQDTTLQNNIDNVQTNLDNSNNIFTNDINSIESDITDLNTSKADKTYVDSIVSGLDAKQSVKVSTTSNITLSGIQTIDGYTTVAGDRVLVKDQTNATENGIYDISSGTWARSSDADNTPANEVSGGMYCFVENGTTSANTGYVLSSPSGNAVLGTDDLVFIKFSNVTLNANDVLDKLKTVDGSGSGLDADKLDNLNSSQFLRSDIDQTLLGKLIINSLSTMQDGDSILHLLSKGNIGSNIGLLIEMDGEGKGSSGEDRLIDLRANVDGTLVSSADSKLIVYGDGSLETVADITAVNITASNNLQGKNITETSSIKYKENIKPIVNAYDTISKLQGVTYNWKDDGKADIGFIAEDVYKIIPELIKKDKTGEIEGMNYSKLTSMIVEAVKSQQVQIDELKKEINKLK